MYKKNIKQKISSYKVPYKNETYTPVKSNVVENNPKSSMTGKRKLRSKISEINTEDVEKKSSLKVPESSFVSKRTRIRKTKIQTENIKIEKNVSNANFNSFNGSNIEMNNGNQDETGTYTKNELEIIQTVVENEKEIFSRNIIDSDTNCNGNDCYKMNTNAEIMNEINLLILDMINHVCENERGIKVSTTDILQFDQVLSKNRNIAANNKPLSIAGVVTNFSSLSETEINDNPKDNNVSENLNFNHKGIGDLKILTKNPNSSADKIEGNVKEIQLKKSGSAEVMQNQPENDENRNILDFQEGNLSKFPDLKAFDDFKRKIEYEPNETDLNGAKQKKQRMNSTKLSDIQESGLSDEIKDAENLHLNKNNNKKYLKDSFEKMINTSCKSEIFLPQEGTVNIKNNLNDLKISNPTEYVVANGNEPADNLKTGNLKYDTSKESLSFDEHISLKKPLSIPCMSALDYDKEFKLMNIECPQKSSPSVAEIQEDKREFNHEDLKLCSSSKNLSSNENVSIINDLEENMLSDLSPSNEHSLKFTNQEHSKPLITEIARLSCKRKRYEDKNITFSPEENDAVETNSDVDRIEHQTHDLITSKAMDIISEVTHSKKRNIEGVISKIFADDHFISEKIIFREKEETDDTDVIPTGIFKHLNEIYEYNEETTSIDVKCVSDNLDMHDINDFKDERKIKTNSKNPIENLKMGETMFLISAKDFLTSENKKDSEKIINVKNEDEDKERDTSKIRNSPKLMDFLSRNKDILKRKTNDNQQDAIAKNENEILEMIGESGDSRETAFANMNQTKGNKGPEKTCTKPNEISEEKYLTDFESCMEMDDDFNLTASQLSMLDADERIQSNSQCNKITTGQQTDLCGRAYSSSNTFELEIINQLNLIRESIECLREKLEKTEGRNNRP
ncbi:uncharacterized protein TNIN_116741 [Trichonephila inaurata madagascariensis]|uniref:Uncharacterized protein n=1 Tax=Trichonephila inaurata madagascariensis TaxID=2747483 RepID=A0A8X6IRZ5_9ARAC|nr:uncharacterized protein TNIN_116741 [Trichonephila inaurata madagascariensis]